MHRFISFDNQEMFSGMDVVGLTPNEISVEYVNGVNVYGTGLKNEAGEYNCFLNVIIQVVLQIQKLFFSGRL